MYILGHIQGLYELCCSLYKCDGTEGARCQSPPLTICDLQLSLGQDAACDGQGLADIVTGVSPLHGRNGEVAAGRHREATAGLLRLVGKEQILRKEEQTFQLGRSLNRFDLETGQNTLPQKPARAAQ